MTLTTGQTKLIRESFDLLKPQVEEASERFYERLFELDPGLRSLFRSDMAGQGMKFMTTLGTIIDQIDNPAALHPHLLRLAQGHAAYGVRPEHFATMGQALVRTMEEVLGDDLTPEAREAWAAAYGLIAREMIGLADGA